VELSWAVGRRGTVVVDGGGAGAVVTDNEALALHHGGEKEKEVRWGREQRKTGAAGGSPSGRMVAAMRPEFSGEWRSKDGADGKAMRGLPVGCSE
jgi:hypothetical protein